MKLSDHSIKALGRIVTGAEGLSPCRSGPMLVELFNEFGFDDHYGQGFPSRWQYAEDRLRALNGIAVLPAVIRHVLDSREFMDSDKDRSAAIEYLNARLRYDGFEVVLVDDMPKVCHLKGAEVEFKHPFEGSMEDGHVFIEEQLAKASRKVRDGDYDGAITNARSLLEAVLIQIELRPKGSNEQYDGDLLKLYKRVQKELGLDPSRPDLEQSLKQTLTGLTSVVCGIAGVSNKMGDRHVRTYRPARRHAMLVVNSTKTLANFLFETWREREDVSS